MTVTRKADDLTISLEPRLGLLVSPAHPNHIAVPRIRNVAASITTSLFQGLPIAQNIPMARVREINEYQ